MNFIQLCTQSTHPLVRKALEGGGWHQTGTDYWLHEDGYEPDDAEPYHEAAVAWEMQWELAMRDKILRILPGSSRESAYRGLLRAVEALEVEDDAASND